MLKMEFQIQLTVFNFTINKVKWKSPEPNFLKSSQAYTSPSDSRKIQSLAIWIILIIPFDESTFKSPDAFRSGLQDFYLNQSIYGHITVQVGNT